VTARHVQFTGIVSVWTWLEDELHGVAGRMIGVAIALIVVVLLVRWARRAAARAIDDNTVRYRTRKVIGVAGAVLAVVIAGAAFSDSLSGLPIVLGATVAGIALALQEVITSVAGWLAIASGNAFKPGDRIELGGVRGDVIDIGVLRTTLMEIGQWVDADQYCGRIVRVANSAVFKQPVYNYTAHFPFLWDEIVVPIRYGSDRARARELLVEAANAVTGDYTERTRTTWNQLVERFMIEDANLTPMVSLVATDNWLQYTVRYVVDVKSRRTTRDRLFERVLAAIDNSKGTVQLASATLQIVNPPEPGRRAA